MKFLVPIILLLVSIASFVMFTNPIYQGTAAACPSTDVQNPYGNCSIKQLQAFSSQYNTALDNAQQLQAERDALDTKLHNISQDSLDRLSKMLPDNADNIRYIIDLQQMAQSYGMSLDSIKFDAPEDDTATSTVSALSPATPGTVAAATAGYGTFNLEFTTTASYANFLSFIKDIESNLRLSDIQSIDFSNSDDPTKVDDNTYTVKLSTYWLKS